LFPSLAAPQFIQHGGHVVTGYDLAITAPAGAIYYTLDGSDPRVTGGGIAAGAQTYSQPIDLTSTTLVKSRVLSGGVWSALTEALFTVDTPLRVSEIMYNPLGSDDAEFIELVNIHPTETIALAGVRFSLDTLGEGIEYEFLPSDGNLSLGPGEYLVIVKDRAAFSALYPDVPSARIADRVFTGSLANEGETISLLDAGDGTVQSFAFSDDWYPSTDNVGRSLVILNPLGTLDRWSLQSGWRPSGFNGGSPAAVDVDPAPTVDIVDVIPDPRISPVDGLQFTFSEPVTGFDLADIVLSRDGGPNLLTGAQTLNTTDGVTWTLDNLAGITQSAGNYTLALNAVGSEIADSLGQLLAGNAVEDFVVRSAVMSRQVFYNQSKFDGSDATANANDDAAIATDKSALLPGGTASFANYTSYGRGLNGIMVDIANLPAGAVLSANDFSFKVGNTDTPSAWANLAGVPTVSMRPVPGGPAGTTRVTLIWPTGAAIKQWLQVAVKANGNTGLTVPDVFYFGNAVGESGNVVGDYSVSITDEIIARNNPVSINPGTTVLNRFDYNRDGTVSVVDQILARNNITTGATKLQQIIVPSALSGSGLVAQGLDESSDIARGLAASSLVSSSGTASASSSGGSTSSSSRLQPRALSAAYGEGESLLGKRRTAPAASVDNELLELLASGK
jgi:hypothetical protein